MILSNRRSPKTLLSAWTTLAPALGTALIISLSTLMAALPGCDRRDGPGQHQSQQTDQMVRDRWARPLNELPTAHLVLISPHNTNIQNEFEWAFARHYAVEYGANVQIEWRDVGGGGSTILRDLRNVYSRTDTSGVDVIWGGGEYVFSKLAAEGMLVPLQLADDVLDNIPAVFGGLQMYDPQMRWCGAAVSGFGFLYNSVLLRRLDIEPPSRWDDLAEPRFFGLICLADPTQSGSAAAVYEMIVQSAPSWPAGWAKLLAILAQSKKFFDSAGAAAEAPALGEAPLATCIDFYGTMRVAGAPTKLVYVSPQGQTAFTPDPIGLLKGAPQPQLAQRFVDFVMSPPGQALWALRRGSPDGPLRNELGRQPIRRDVYRTYGPRFSHWITDPYKEGNELQVDTQMQKVRFGVLRQLVRAAAIDNQGLLRAARRRLIDSGFETQLLAEFNSLPPNVASRAQIAPLAQRLRGPKQAEQIVADWTAFFRKKYQRVLR